MQVTAPANELTGTYGISTDAILPQGNCYSGSCHQRSNFYLRNYSVEPYSLSPVAKLSGSCSISSFQDKT